MSLDREHVKAAILAAVQEVFRIADGSTIREETAADDVDGWDSLSHTMLLMNIEERLGCQLPLERVYAATNVGGLIDIISGP